MKRLLTYWRCWRRGVPRELWGTSNEDIPAEQWGGWQHTVEHVDEVR